MLNQAKSSVHRAVEIQPNYVEALANLGSILKELGSLDEAEACFRRALQLKPGYTMVFSNLLFVLNYHPDRSADEIFRAYQEFDAAYCLPYKKYWQKYLNSRDVRRRLRVGYVSPDFRRHSVQYFLEPLLANHNKRTVEVFAYAELAVEDSVTSRYKDYVDQWVPTRGLSDAALAERIHADEIDILVDLAGHTAKNRLPVFARKPAPVSVSWLGYGYTTGLTAIDYFLTDSTIVPQGSEAYFTETPCRIATPSFSYRPAEGMGDINALPALRNGYITFGVFTRAIRINHRTIQAWVDIMKQVPDSRLVIDSKSFGEWEMQEMLAEKFVVQGIQRERLEIGYHSPPWDVLRRIDIGLDCFPHNSGTTLLETLYMGVPFITLAGRPSVGRIGASVLYGLARPEWVAESQADYVNKAINLAKDLEQLSVIRATLREQMERSPIRDEKGFVLKVESAYRRIWEKWCQQGEKAD